MDAAQKSAILAAVSQALDKDPPKVDRGYVILWNYKNAQRVFLLDIPADYRGDVANYALIQRFEPLYEMVMSGWEVAVSGPVQDGEFVEIGR